MCIKVEDTAKNNCFYRKNVVFYTVSWVHPASCPFGKHNKASYAMWEWPWQHNGYHLGMMRTRVAELGKLEQ